MLEGHSCEKASCAMNLFLHSFEQAKSASRHVQPKLQWLKKVACWDSIRRTIPLLQFSSEV